MAIIENYNVAMKKDDQFNNKIFWRLGQGLLLIYYAMPISLVCL